MGISEDEKKKRRNIEIEEWRQIGYFVEIDKEEKAFRLIGSPCGLGEFCYDLEEYVIEDENDVVGEHIHLTPAGYLRIETSLEPMVNGYAISGSLDDLSKLVDIVASRLKDENIGKQIEIKEHYSSESTWAIILDIRDYGFDPASLIPGVIGASG